MDEQFPLIDSIILAAGHSAIIGHVPEGKFTLKDVGAKQVLEQKDIASLGLFDNSTPNYTTYYPDVTAEDLNPQDAEFIYPVFRLLSNVIVHKRYNPIEFPAEVLKKSMKMLVGQTVNVDHETALGNAIGSIVEVEWQESYKDASGVVVPAGINGKLKIDGKSNPRIARGVLMDPPSIHSNSVTVRFKWEPSHTMEDMDEFWSKLGSYDENGEMYRRIVTEIVAYSETSLVAHGADPYAKLIKDSKIINPKMADMFYSFKQNGEEVKESKYFMIDYKDNLSELSMSAANTGEAKNEDESTTPKNVNNKHTNKTSMKQQLLSLCLILGISDESTLTEENWLDTVKEKFSILTEKAGTADTLQAKIDELTQSNEMLTTENTSLKANAEIGEAALKEARDEALRLYNLAKGDAADEAMQGVIANSSYENALTLQKQFATDTEEEFAATCSDCGSSNVTRASSKSEEEEEEGSEEFKIKEDKDVVANMRKKKNGVKASFIESESTES